VDVLGCELPEDRLYDLEQGVWWQPEPEGGTARLGLLATVAAFAGPFRELTFRPVEGPLVRGRSVATVESTRYTGAVRLPVDATVVDRNAEVRRRPRLLNDRPYTDGWIVRVRPRSGELPVGVLGPAAEVRGRLEEEIRARHIRCWPLTPETELVEVGIECTAVLVRLNEEIARRAPGEALLLVTDDPTSPIEMVRWSDRTGHRVRAHRLEGTFHQFLVEKLANPVPRPRGPTGAREPAPV
jgi:glycine cleavage system H protein